MGVTLDAERVWKVACDVEPCGWRTYVTAATVHGAMVRARDVFGATVAADGTVRCAQHREAS